jgi:hypothetical protein
MEPIEFSFTCIQALLFCEYLNRILVTKNETYSSRAAFTKKKLTLKLVHDQLAVFCPKVREC